MDVLSEWSHKWMLKINNGKTKVVHFRKASTPATEYTFNIGDTVIERTDSYRYLGLHINDTLDFNFGVSILSQSSSRALGTIISKHFSVGGFPHEPYRRMYDTLVAPVMDYAAEVWGAKNYDQCHTVQHRAMRTFLGVSRCTLLPPCMVICSGTPPMSDTRYQWYGTGCAWHGFPNHASRKGYSSGTTTTLSPERGTGTMISSIYSPNATCSSISRDPSGQASHRIPSSVGWNDY